ncbi:hypothetical protein [Kocuria sp. CH-021]|uniref:hypothetical protein n=1 Tax=Kocuria sp. CH-021 TaxID=3406735 RepID=UPI003C757C6F
MTTLRTRPVEEDVPDVLTLNANATFGELTPTGIVADSAGTPALEDVGVTPFHGMLADAWTAQAPPAPLVPYVVPARFQTDYTVAFASYLMAMAPLLVVYAFAQRWVISGVTRGAVE